MVLKVSRSGFIYLWFAGWFGGWFGLLLLSVVVVCWLVNPWLVGLLVCWFGGSLLRWFSVLFVGFLSTVWAPQSKAGWQQARRAIRWIFVTTLQPIVNWKSKKYVALFPDNMEIPNVWITLNFSVLDHIEIPNVRIPPNFSDVLFFLDIMIFSSFQNSYPRNFYMSRCSWTTWQFRVSR